MDGYDVLTFDDHKAGHVVGREGSFIVVEHGAIFKHRRPVPETFATVDDESRTVRLTISKDILETAPEIRDAGLDEQAAAQHYGLAGVLDGHDGLESASATLMGQVTLAWDDERTSREQLLEAMARGGFREQALV